MTWLTFMGGNNGYYVTLQPALVKAWIHQDAAYIYNEKKPLTILKPYQQALIFHTEQCRDIVIVDEAFRQQFQGAPSLPAHSIVCLPILYKGQLKGIMLLENTEVSDAFHLNQRVFLAGIATFISTTLENVHVYEHIRELDERRTKELELANEALRKANEKLAQLEAERKQLFHNISHELRSPITSSIGYIESILDGVVEEKELMTYLQRSKERLDMLNHLIQDIFDLTNIESGRIAFNFYEMPVVDFVHYFSDRFQQEVLAASLSYRLTIGDIGGGVVVIDLERMEQVFWHLIRNALKYTKQGEIHVLFDVVEQQLRCRIRDTGRGISEEDQAFIFASYYQEVNVPQISSTGIGLSICKQIILQHQGEIWVHSEMGRGTTFTFVLPITVRPSTVKTI